MKLVRAEKRDQLRTKSKNRMPTLADQIKQRRPQTRMKSIHVIRKK